MMKNIIENKYITKPIIYDIVISVIGCYALLLLEFKCNLFTYFDYDFYVHISGIVLIILTLVMAFKENSKLTRWDNSIEGFKFGSSNIFPLYYFPMNVIKETIKNVLIFSIIGTLIILIFPIKFMLGFLQLFSRFFFVLITLTFWKSILIFIDIIDFKKRVKH